MNGYKLFLPAGRHLMATRNGYDDAYDDWGEDEESDEEFQSCPECQCEFHADAYQCPRCGYYPTEEDRAAGHGRSPVKSAWIIATVIVCLLLVLTWILGPVLPPPPEPK